MNSPLALPVHAPVLTIEPVNETIRDYFRLPASARHALFEHYQGHAEVLATDDQCPSGIAAAARSWARQTGAAFSEAA